MTGAKTKGAMRIAAGQRVTVENVTFEGNRCDGNLGDLGEGDVGGAIRCNSNLKLVGCTFRNNSCTTHGGAVGIYSNDYHSRFVIENCTFENNTAGEAGGALFLGCSGRIQNTRISGNRVTGREDGATEGQNETSVGQGGGIYLTRHGGVAFGDDSEGFWWGRFEGPTIMIEEGVTITNNTASLTKESAATANNLYLSRHWNSYNNAAVMVSGDTRAETKVGLTLSEEEDVFTRTLNEEGGERLTDDYSSWFFGDTSYLVPVFDGENGLMRLEDHRLPPGVLRTFTANTAEAAVATAVKLLAPSEEVAAALDAESAAAYVTLFAPVVTEQAPGEWSIVFEPTDEATARLVQTANDALAAVLAAMLDPTVDTVSFPACPGFFYAIEYGAGPGLGANTAGELAKGTGVELRKPDHTGPSGFFRVKVSSVMIDASSSL